MHVPIYNNTSSTITAENNWWGDPSGPSDPSNADGLSNPSGKGDKVSDYVDYSPWLTSNPFSLDSDGDGIPDAWEKGLWGNLSTADGRADYDGDGLLDKDEYLHQTNPKNKDTDGDSLPDGWEVTHGTDPLAFDSFEDTDSDGYSNLREYHEGTDPQDSQNTPVPAIIYVDGKYGKNTLGLEAGIEAGIEDGTASHPFSTIQQGVDFAGAKETVYVYSGEYIENIFIAKDIFLIGESPESTIINGGFVAAPVIYFLQTTNAGIEGFSIKNGLGAGIKCEQATVSIRRNIISNTLIGHGLKISAGSSLSTVSIENNLIYDNDLDGINLSGQGITASILNTFILTASILNNTIVFNGGDGIEIKNNIIILNNIIVGHGNYGLFCEECQQSSQPDISHNLIMGNTIANYSGCSAGGGDLAKDPCFNDQAGRDFHLTSASPAIDSGTRHGTPDSDLNGMGRFDYSIVPNTGDNGDSYYDIGAYEYLTAERTINPGLNLLSFPCRMDLRDLSWKASDLLAYLMKQGIKVQRISSYDKSRDGWQSYIQQNSYTQVENFEIIPDLTYLLYADIKKEMTISLPCSETYPRYTLGKGLNLLTFLPLSILIPLPPIIYLKNLGEIIL